MAIILNLTQHSATPDQKLDGVVDLPPEDQGRLRALLTVPITGSQGIVGASEGAVNLALEVRAAEIVSAFILPRVMENARAILHHGGYEASGLEALGLLRPEVAADGLAAMVAGFAPLMERLIPQLKAVGVRPLYALSERRSEEELLPDGSVAKVGSFRHEGFFPAR